MCPGGRSPTQVMIIGLKLFISGPSFATFPTKPRAKLDYQTNGCVIYAC
jgi:hypothetical protein